MYRTLNEHYREKFGCKVYELSLDGGFTCPNRDGCSAQGGGEFAESPGTDIAEQLERTKARVAAGSDGVKFHLLHVLRDTDLAKDYKADKFRCLTMEEYAQWLILCLRQLPPATTVHRITGDGARRDLIAPLWSADKKRVLNFLHSQLRP